MKKTLLLLFAALGVAASVQAQINWGNYTHSFPDDLTKDPSTVGLILAIRKGNDTFWELGERSKQFEILEKDPAFRRARSGEIVARTTFDTARAQFFLQGVRAHNAHLYEFQVTEYPTKRVVVPWHLINRFTDSTLIQRSALPKMAYLGGYKTGLGKMLIMDVRKLNDNRIVATSLVAWEPIKPVITSIYTSETLDEFFQRLQSPWMPDNQSVGRFSPVLTVPATNANLIFSLQSGRFSKDQIQYELMKDGRVYTPWRNNTYANSFVWIKDCPPGSYLIKIRYTAQPQHTNEYRFEVEPAWHQTTAFRLVAGGLATALVGLLLLLIHQRRKSRQQQAIQSKLQLELKALYAQLNPHFVFNALSSIQGLINKGEIKAANQYLSDFARLMRQSLQYSQKVEIALHEEIQTLDTYLKLEQLRFGFSYTIQVDPIINASETNIPALLLQPLVENAVKHGAALRQEKGIIHVTFQRSDHNLIATIMDNGNGFAEGTSTPGLGLKLTRDRIHLLNQLHPDWKLSLSIQSANSSGATLTLTFSHWF